MSKDCGDCKHEDNPINEKPCLYCKRDLWEPKEEEKVNKNYVKEFMDDNGLKIGEEFTTIDNKVTNYIGISPRYHFNQNYELYDATNRRDCVCSYELRLLLTGCCSVFLKPFSPTNLPKEGEGVWVVKAFMCDSYAFDNSCFWMYALVASGNAFRTEEEAKANAPRIRKEQGMCK